jgi:hypothetical protein
MKSLLAEVYETPKQVGWNEKEGMAGTTGLELANSCASLSRAVPSY